MFKINKGLRFGLYRVVDVVKGLENSAALKKVFGLSLDRILNLPIVEISDKEWMIFVDQQRGVICVSINYLVETDDTILYLDFLHELVHVKQWLEGKDLFDKRCSYVERPTEIEAYKLTCEEARAIGMPLEEIVDYLHVDWIDDTEHKKLVDAVLAMPAKV